MSAIEPPDRPFAIRIRADQLGEVLIRAASVSTRLPLAVKAARHAGTRYSPLTMGVTCHCWSRPFS
jgi:hypothetical protein